MEGNQIIPAERILPNRLLVLPMVGNPIFPGVFTPLIIESEHDIEIVNASLQGDNLIGLVLTRDSENPDYSPEGLYSVGTVAKIVKKINLPDGGLNIFISTVKRFKVVKYLALKPITAAVDYLEDIFSDPEEIKALTRSLLTEMKQISKDNPIFTEEMRLNMVNIDQPGKIADFVTSIMNINRNDQQRILETMDLCDRLEQVLLFIKKEHELMKIQQKIQRRINDRIEKNQREYFLKEELKAIQHELGLTSDPKTSDYNRYREYFDSLDLPDETREQINKELEKFQLMDPNSAEFTVTRNYLETLAALPWEDPVTEEYELNSAKEILDADHYGLEDVKERILEYLAVRKMKRDTKGSIICLVGPPGVGKTSVGLSIARALNKKFFRFSVGGMRDEAEIKGHRRTYIGSMPGKIIQGLKIVKTKNPVFMIDEIDKMGASFQGDPSSALLEVLDPEQNHAFRDHYLDVPFDVSNILFIVTANTLDTIPRPLLDRMEVIRLSGYITDDKVAIAKKYLIPKTLKNNGLKRKTMRYSMKALRSIADEYAREAGMRNYEKALDRIHRKVAKKLMLGETETPVTISPDNLPDFLGKPVFREDELKRATTPGIVVGLAWTHYGGDVLMIESINIQGKGGMKLTGKLGEVMQESANIAYSFVRHIAKQYDLKQSYFDSNLIHLHIPEGATPKDGPSAGITMACSLFSLAKGKRIKANLAMTGELSLAGKVLPIGGLKEKTIAARRNRIKEIIIPKANLRDLDEIPDHVKKGITFHPVSTMTEVIEIAFAMKPAPPRAKKPY